MPGMSLDRVNPVIMADQGHLNDEIPAKTPLLVDAECCTNTNTAMDQYDGRRSHGNPQTWHALTRNRCCMTVSGPRTISMVINNPQRAPYR